MPFSYFVARTRCFDGDRVADHRIRVFAAQILFTYFSLVRFARHAACSFKFRLSANDRYDFATFSRHIAAPFTIDTLHVRVSWIVHGTRGVLLTIPPSAPVPAPEKLQKLANRVQGQGNFYSSQKKRSPGREKEGAEGNERTRERRQKGARRGTWP